MIIYKAHQFGKSFPSVLKSGPFTIMIKGKKHIINSFHPIPSPRAYPSGFAECLIQCYEEHLAEPGRRDLRFKPQLDPSLSEVEQFKQLPMGDLWEDGSLLDVLDYMINSKRCRTGCGIQPKIIIVAIMDCLPQKIDVHLIEDIALENLHGCTSAPGRIPPIWHKAIHTFYDEYRCAASLLQTVHCSPVQSITSQSIQVPSLEATQVMGDVGLHADLLKQQASGSDSMAGSM